MNPMQIMAMLNQFKQNPMAILGKRFNLPENLNNPQDIINHLLSSGQINKNMVDQATQMKNQFFGK
jgi:hypothetical protein